MKNNNNDRSTEDHDWIEDGTDVYDDKDYKCLKCEVWASHTLELWSPGGCSGKKKKKK